MLPVLVSVATFSKFLGPTQVNKQQNHTMCVCVAVCVALGGGGTTFPCGGGGGGGIFPGFLPLLRNPGYPGYIIMCVSVRTCTTGIVIITCPYLRNFGCNVALWSCSIRK